MKFDEICDLLFNEAYKDKYLVIDEDRLDSFRHEIMTPGSEAQQRLLSVVSTSQVGLKEFSPKYLLRLLIDLEALYVTSPSKLDDILKTIKVDIRDSDFFPETPEPKAKRAAKALFTFLKKAGIFVVAGPQKETDIEKIISDPESEDWMSQNNDDDDFINDYLGGDY